MENTNKDIQIKIVNDSNFNLKSISIASFGEYTKELAVYCNPVELCFDISTHRNECTVKLTRGQLQFIIDKMQEFINKNI
jgi:hypothetical protein